MRSTGTSTASVVVLAILAKTTTELRLAHIPTLVIGATAADLLLT